MKKVILLSFFILLAFSFSAFAQKDKKPILSIDKILELDAKHNLDVAWQYFKLRKAYKASLLRAEEIMAAHPTFSKKDEVLYLSGMSSYYLSIGKGKQKLNLSMLSKNDKIRFAPKRLREDAVALLSKFIEEHPKSKYIKKAQKALKKLKPKE